jgi:hypothetical protein
VAKWVENGRGLGSERSEGEQGREERGAVGRREKRRTPLRGNECQIRHKTYSALTWKDESTQVCQRKDTRSDNWRERERRPSAPFEYPNLAFLADRFEQEALARAMININMEEM